MYFFRFRVNVCRSYERPDDVHVASACFVTNMAVSPVGLASQSGRGTSNIQLPWWSENLWREHHHFGLPAVSVISHLTGWSKGYRWSWNLLYWNLSTRSSILLRVFGPNTETSTSISIRPLLLPSFLILCDSYFFTYRCYTVYIPAASLNDSISIPSFASYLSSHCVFPLGR
jgi:hypothetical protein